MLCALPVDAAAMLVTRLCGPAPARANAWGDDGASLLMLLTKLLCALLKSIQESAGVVRVREAS